MRLSRLLVQQLGRPSRLTARLLNLTNARINRQAVELLELSRGHRVLEVGFGGGAALARLLGQATFVAAIDPSEASVRAARRRFGDELRRGRLRIEQATVEQMPFMPGSFDRALTVHTIYFWADLQRGLSEILRVLAPGGRLVLATDTRRVPARVAQHGFRSYREDQQVDLLRAAGFSGVRLERRPPFLFALAEKLPEGAALQTEAS